MTGERGDKSMDQIIEECIEEIHKYKDGVHELNPGIDRAIIKAFETKYNINLPEDYKDFLTVYNGGELFIPGTVVSGVFDEEKEIKDDNGDYLHLNLTNKWPDMGDELLIIADLNYGDMICYDSKRQVIVQWDHEIGEVTIEWDTFAEWLQDEMKAGSELVDYNGNEKE